MEKRFAYILLNQQMNHLLIIIYIIGTHTCFHKKHKNAKIQNCGVLAEHDAFDGDHQKNFFTPLQAHGMEKITAWRGRKIFLATQKDMAFITKSLYSNKILQICKNISVFILLKQNKAISLQRNSKQQNNH